MTADEVFEKVISDLRHLEKFVEVSYLTGKNFLTNIRVDSAHEKVTCTRGEKKVTIGFDKIKQACAELSKGKPTSLDMFVTVSLNIRSVIETLLAQVANVGFLPANKPPNVGGKKLILFEKEVHPVGELFDACAYLLENKGLLNLAPSFDIAQIPPQFCAHAKEFANLTFAAPFATRLCAALLAKRFLILTGLSGSGKTKIAQAFAQWLAPEGTPNPYCALIPVGADWVGSDNILGYPNGLDPTAYITRQALDLIIHAQEPEHADVPHFLILDEMNLSHVERYFADILSAIESEDAISLYEGPARSAGPRLIPNRIVLPRNLFIIGTVNVDETTYMFSPKVLDRANVIEFRMAQQEVAAFFNEPAAPELEELQGMGAHFGEAFVAAARDKSSTLPDTVKAPFADEMLLLFGLLQQHNLEFGYRTAYESARFVRYFHLLGGQAPDDANWLNTAMDALLIQKILPRLHGSRAKLEGLLWALAWFCAASRDALGGNDFSTQLHLAGKAEDDAQFNPEQLWQTLAKQNPANPAAQARYPKSFAKIMRMWQRLVREQFVTFTEA